MSEVQHALKKIKPGKAPGPDNITSELLKEGGTNLHMWLHDLVNRIFSTRDIPTQLKISEIITQHKKGDSLECGSYRHISLLSHMYKLVMNIIYNRIKHDLISTLPKTHAA